MGYVGKFHYETEGLPTDYGVDEFVSLREYGQWRKRKGLSDRPRQNGWFGEVDAHILPEESRLSWGANHAVRMIEEGAASDNPFFVRWDPSEPHLPNVVPEPYASMYHPTAEPELYDVKSDPGELNNRAADPECEPVAAELRRRLFRWMEEIGDPLLNPWTRTQLKGDVV